MSPSDGLCGVEHPDRPGVRCDKRASCYGHHRNVEHELTWPGIPLPATQAADPGLLVDLRQRTVRRRRGGTP